MTMGKKRPVYPIGVVCQRRISDTHVGTRSERAAEDRYCFHAASSHNGDGCTRCSCEGLVRGRD